jgi:NAD(P)-dependent dehydrogenase (short-subunit alcohol dehydrogenase family)
MPHQSRGDLAGAADGTEVLRRPLGLRLDGSVAWVTGASRGLGRAIAFALAAAGAELLLTARDEGALDEVATAIRAAGFVVHTVPGSVTDPARIADAVSVAAREWQRIDVLVNNAGISPAFVRAERLADDAWADVLDVNLTGLFRCTRAALPLLEQSAAASVVNISSIHGHAATERIVAYAASKGGVEMLTRTLALEWAERGIRVNSIAPGYLETEMTRDLRSHRTLRENLLRRIPMARFGSPAEIAATVLFLACPVSSYITGATVFADGGWTAR